MVIEAKDFDEFAGQLSNYDIAGSQTRLEPLSPNAGEVVELEEGEEICELEVDEDAILYYIEDEDGNEIGFAVEEDGKEVEYYYADDHDHCGCGCGCEDDAVEMEVDEDAILYYIEDEDGNEIGFAIEEDGKPVEYFYAQDEDELIDMEVDEDAILYYIEDEAGNEIGFAIEEDGKPVEYYYAEDEVAPAPAAAAPAAKSAPKKQDSILTDIRRKTDGVLARAEEKLDNDEMSEGAKKVMGGVAEAADTMKEIKDTMREFKEAFSFKL